MRRLAHANDNVLHLINSRLTKKLITLRAKSYELDFILPHNRRLACLQSDENFPEEYVSVRVVDQVYDLVTNSYKYLHTVETACGGKGILLMEGMYGFSLKFHQISSAFILVFTA